ncbi:signal peptidase II [Catellatospora methionotrophica]|uniref:signal peptidase II n=1 Tax=Catellatospora methionotrophica TaxID=121620 RepID=UPI00340EC1A5
MADASAAPARPARRRLLLAAAVTGLAAADLLVKALAEDVLAAGAVKLPGLQLKLLYNDGVAFSFARSLPAWAIVVFTGMLTAGLAAYALAVVPRANRLRCVAGAAVVAGAAANLLDRARDGVVTDYLHTGWFPTFNLADVYLSAGVGLLILAEWRQARRQPPAQASAQT